MTQPTYSPNGAGHRALSVLATGPCIGSELKRHAMGWDATSSERKKFSHLRRQMLADGLVILLDRGWYAITDLGLEVLSDLRAGMTWGGEPSGPMPNCRVFVTERRAA